MSDLDHEDLLGEDIDAPNSTRDNLVIGGVALALIVITLLFSGTVPW
jgi:hypothetical protein